MPWKVGAMVESLGMAPRQGIAKLAELGADGFQVYVTEGELAVENLAGSAADEFKQYVDGLGLTISALCVDYRNGFTDANHNDATIPKVKACIDLAVALDVRILTTHIGTPGDDPAATAHATCTEALRDLGAYASQRERVFATETGLESGQSLRAFIEQVGSDAVRVNYDPANLVMNGFDYLGGVDLLGPYIVHTHAKDGRAEPRAEVPLGEGDVDWPAYLARLRAAGYDGFLTIEREAGADPGGDVARAIEFLRGFE